MLYLIQIGFFTITFWDILDIFIVGFLLFQIYKLLKGSLGFNIFIGLVLVYIAWRMVSVLEMPLLSSILGQFVSVGMIALLILFQPEVRRFLLFVGQGSLQTRFKFLQRFFKQNQFSEDRKLLKTKTIESIVKATKSMSATKTGALMVFSSAPNLEGLYSSGVTVNADVSAQLILSIFQKESPLHDGAMILKDQKIIAASCVLPVSDRPNIPQRLGLRHRAAVGISENTNIMVFIISEETGNISYARGGEIIEQITLNKMKHLLERILFIS